MSRSQKGVAPLIQDDGLHPIEQHNYPELVPNHQNLPEVVREKEDQKYVTILNSDCDKHVLPAPPGYNSNIYQAEGAHNENQPDLPTNASKRRRICGLRRRAFILVAVVLIIILLAVIGGVLGGVLASKRSSSSASTASNSGPANNSTTANNSTAVNNAAYTYTKAQGMTGLAMVGTTDSSDGSSRLYAYYTNEAGTIIELAYPANTWRQDFKTSNLTITNVTNNAIVNSSIAAVAYTRSDGQQIRQIFYYSNSNNVITSTSTSSSSSGTWSAPFTLIPTATAKRHDSPLAAIVGTNSNGLNGLRVYYGSDAGWIQEMGINFAGSVLNTWQFQFHYFIDPDSTGIAAVAAGTVSHLYLRNQATFNLWQGTYDFSSGENKWTFFDLLSPLAGGTLPGYGSSIAAASTGNSATSLIDRIAYRANNSATLLATYSGASNTTSDNAFALDTSSYSQLNAGLAAYGTDTDTIILSQDPDQSNRLMFQSMGLSGNVQQTWWTDTGI